MRRILRELKYFLWALNGFIGPKSRSKFSQKATVLITYYNPARMKHINHQLRNILKSDFVEKIIISNHNPEIDIASRIRVSDERVTVINQNVRRGCGHRWVVADQYSPDYLIVVDDDILIFPWQLRQLFEALVAEPEIPHGFAGMVHHENGFIEYREREERSLDYICEIYALTGDQLKRYMELREVLLEDESLANMVESAADFMVVSRSGIHRPKIHNAGKLFRCPTYNEKGVAVHQGSGFDQSIFGVAKALNELTPKPNSNQSN